MTPKKYAGENAFARFLNNIKGIFAPITHEHSAAEVGADVAGSAADALKNAKEYTDQSAYVHPTTSGNKHIPSGGSSGQILRWSADGAAAWGEDNDTVYTHPNSGVAAGTYERVTVNAQGHVTGGNNNAYVHSATGSNGTAGYVKIAQFKISAGYQNTPIIIELSRRRAAVTCVLYISFASASGADPGLGYFKAMGELYPCYMHRSDTSTWDLYVEKSEAYDNIGVVRYHKPQYLNGVSVTWGNTLVAELPSNTTIAQYGGTAGNAAVASRLSNTSAIGSASQPVYFTASGVPTAAANVAVKPSTSTSAPSTVEDNTIYTFSLSAAKTIAIPASGMIYSSVLRVTNANYITWSGATRYNGDEPASGEVWEFSVLNGSIIGVKLENA